MLLHNNTEYAKKIFPKKPTNSILCIKKRQNESFDNFRLRRIELESCKPNSPLYQAKKQAYEIAAKDFLDSFYSIISFAIKKIITSKKISPAVLSSIKEDIKTDAQMIILGAEKKYCVGGGTSFQNFAIQSLLWNLPHKISQYGDLVQVPVHLMQDRQRTLAKLYSKGIEIEKLSVEEICKLTNCSKNVAESIVGNIFLRDVFSLENVDTSLSNAQTFLKSKEESPLNNAIYSEYLEILRQELHKLTEKRKEVVLAFIGSSKKSLTDTAKKVGLSYARVQQIVSEFMEHITSLISEKK